MLKSVKKILFITGTRADYGKLKALIRKVEASEDFDAYIFVSGMHLIETLGNTYSEILKDGYRNVYIAYGLANTRQASYDLGDVICQLTGYVSKVQPDMIVVHGDRIDALAGAAVGALNNIRVAHIEGGELSGTVDESIRHAISKLSHIHLVCNEEAKQRLIQMGEKADHVYVIGSPDIDVMMSSELPTLDEAKARYELPFEEYGILIYHPVTTEYTMLGKHVQEVVEAAIQSGKNYIVVYPNNDLGYELILNEYRRFEEFSRFRVFPSIRFEYFLTLLKNAAFMIGNSSAGVRETGIYGVPAIDIGTRQSGRYTISENSNIQHVDENRAQILKALSRTEQYRRENQRFGDGNSTKRFMEILQNEKIWEMELQKQFIDFNR